MPWCNNVCHHNDDDNYGESLNYDVVSDENHKVWYFGCFGECSEALIYLGGAADADIVTNYILADCGKVPEAGALSPAKKS